MKRPAGRQMEKDPKPQNGRPNLQKGAELSKKRFKRLF